MPPGVHTKRSAWASSESLVNDQLTPIATCAVLPRRRVHPDQYVRSATEIVPPVDELVTLVDGFDYVAARGPLCSGEGSSIQVEPRIEGSVRENRQRVRGFRRTRPCGERATIASQDL
jgi:hypothetical protein